MTRRGGKSEFEVNGMVIIRDRPERDAAKMKWNNLNAICKKIKNSHEIRIYRSIILLSSVGITLLRNRYIPNNLLISSLFIAVRACCIRTRFVHKHNVFYALV